MSKSSNKQRYTQTMEWVSSMNIKRKKRAKQGDKQSRMEYMNQKRNG